MKILFLDWKCFNRDDTIYAFKKMGHEVVLFYHDDYNMLKSDNFLKELHLFFKKNNPDVAFSYNYYPLMAEGCKSEGAPYISFIYDSPYTYLYSYTLMYPTNYVFLFDRSWVKEFNAGGLNNVHYMVLPANAEKIDSLLCRDYDKTRTESDVSFVGRLYNEKHNFYERLIEKADSYLKGYLEAVCEAQLKISGASLVESLLDNNILEAMEKAMPVQDEGVEPKGYRYANYFIKRKITQIERNRLLKKIGEEVGQGRNIKLFTEDLSVKFNGIKNMGIATYETEMPLVFHNSKINLNISLRSITTGIPLRCIDIMAMGGFLLSNYQEDLAIDFVPGEEFAYYVDEYDLIEKIHYYLEHEKEREEIAINGQLKVKREYSFEKVFYRIFEIVKSENKI